MSAGYQTGMITTLPLVHQGKVRDSFAVGDEHLLMVASDRLSAFDVVLPDPIPGKGEMLTRHLQFLVRPHRRTSCPTTCPTLTVFDVLDDQALATRLQHAPRWSRSSSPCRWKPSCAAT